MKRSRVLYTVFPFLFFSSTHEDYDSRKKSFNEIESLFSLNETLYWTTNSISDVLNEETHAEGYGYFHANIRVGVHIDPKAAALVTTQLVPTPTKVEQINVAFFTRDTQVARISWAAPVRSGDFGCSVWQDWNYRLRYQGRNTNEILEVGAGTSATVEVEPSEIYSFSVQAYSSSGESDWSQTVQAKTLPADIVSDSPQVIAASGSKIFTLAFSGENKKLEVSAVNQVVDVAADGRTVFFTNGSTLVMYKASEDQILFKANDIKSLAVEPYAKKVYFSMPSRQRIMRISYDEGFTSEILPVLSYANNLAIDSVLAQICWMSWKNRVICSSLSGRGVRDVYQGKPYSPTLLVSFALDTLEHKVFLMVKKFDVGGLSIISNDLMGKNSDFSQEMIMKDFIFSGPMRFFYGKLAWLRGVEDKEVVVYDITCKSSSTSMFGSVINSFDIPVSSPLPSGLEVLDVVPHTVNPNSIRIATDENKLVWDHAGGINYGKLSYQLEISIKGSKKLLSSSQESISLNEVFSSGVKPHAKLEVSIVAQTSWAKSEVTNRTIFTPETPPSEPNNLRVYSQPRMTSYGSTSSMEVQFQLLWEKPTEENGIITNYRLETVCAGPTENMRELKICGMKKILPAHGRQFSFSVRDVELQAVESVEFELRAESGAGVGAPTQAKAFSKKDQEFYPRPKLLALGSDLKYSDYASPVDGDFIIRKLNVDRRSRHFTYDAQKQSLFYTLDDVEIMELNLRNNAHKLIYKVTDSKDNKKGIGALTIDYIGRYLYFTEGGVLKFIHTTADNEAVREVVEVKGIQVPEKTLNMEMNPYENAIFLTAEDSSGKVKLYKYVLDLHGSSGGEEPLDGYRREDCSCYKTLSVGIANSFAMLPRQFRGHPDLLIVSKDGKQLYRADEHACSCWHLGTFWTSLLDNFSADFSHIFWADSNSVEVAQVGSARLLSRITINDTSGTSEVVANCEFCQMLPRNAKCLLPQIKDSGLHVKNVTDGSITVNLPMISKHRGECEFGNNLPPTTFTLYYSETIEASFTNETVAHISTSCHLKTPNCFYKTVTVVSPQNDLTIDGLKSFTRYGLYLEWKNEYLPTDIIHKEMTLGTIVETLQGRPEPVTHLSASAITPESAVVRWKPVGGKDVDYEVHYQTEDQFVGGKVLYKHSQDR